MNKLSPRSQKQQLKHEVWYHGCVSRSEAESMLAKDGDFLVRESQGSPGQYVLTGMNHGITKHLLLIDPEGVVSIILICFDEKKKIFFTLINKNSYVH